MSEAEITFPFAPLEAEACRDGSLYLLGVGKGDPGTISARLFQFLKDGVPTEWAVSYQVAGWISQLEEIIYAESHSAKFYVGVARIEVGFYVTAADLEDDIITVVLNDVTFYADPYATPRKIP